MAKEGQGCLRMTIGMAKEGQGCFNITRANIYNWLRIGGLGFLKDD